MKLRYRNPAVYIFMVFGKLFIVSIEITIRVMYEIIVALSKVFTKVLDISVDTLKWMAGARKSKSNTKDKK